MVLISWDPLTIWEILLYGITSVISNKENGMLRTPAVWVMVLTIPLDTPRFSGGTEPIIELVMAGANNASPIPNSSKLTKTVP